MYFNLLCLLYLCLYIRVGYFCGWNMVLMVLSTSLKLFTFFIVSDLLDLCCNILNKALTFLIFEQKFSKKNSVVVQI